MIRSVSICKQLSGDYSLRVNGVRMMEEQSFSVCDAVADQLRQAVSDTSEAGEVADSIRSFFAKRGNPDQSG